MVDKFLYIVNTLNIKNVATCFEILRTYQLIMKYYKFQHLAIDDKYFFQCSYSNRRYLRVNLV